MLSTQRKRKTTRPMDKLFHNSRKPEAEHGATPTLARQMNIREVVKLLQRNPPLTRAEITRRTGISAPTMSKLFVQLEHEGIIHEIKSNPPGPGRPSKCYTLSGRKVQVFVAEIGVKTCRIFTAIPSLELNKIEEREFATPYSYPEMLLQFRQFIETRRDSKIRFLGLGLSVPGLIDGNRQTVVFCPNIRYLDGHTPAPDMVAGFALPTVTVQEEHALCLAEKALGQIGGINNFLVVDVSEGLGVGIFANGALVVGEGGFAGELGHIPMGDPTRLCGCGRYGCLEASATDTALLRRIEAGHGAITMADLIRKVAAGEMNVDAELETTLDYLGKALAVAINLLNPGLILLYGRLFEIKPGLLEQLQSRTAHYALTPSSAHCEIRLATAPRALGALAAIANQLVDSIVR